MDHGIELLRRLYERFNDRDIDAVLASLHLDVIWANGMEGGHLHGHAAVSTYWRRQWGVIDPHVEPLAYSVGPDGEIVVEVHQTVRDLAGSVRSDRVIGHVFRLEAGLVRRFDIRDSASPNSPG